MYSKSHLHATLPVLLLCTPVPVLYCYFHYHRFHPLTHFFLDACIYRCANSPSAWVKGSSGWVPRIIFFLFCALQSPMLDPCCGGWCFTCRQVLSIASASHGTLYECQTCLEQKQTRAESLSLLSTLPLVLCCRLFLLWLTASSFAAKAHFIWRVGSLPQQQVPNMKYEWGIAISSFVTYSRSRYNTSLRRQYVPQAVRELGS